MDRLKVLLCAIVVSILSLSFYIVYEFGFIFLIRLALGLFFLCVFLITTTFTGVLAYAKSKYFPLALIYSLISAFGVYYCYYWEPTKVVFIILFYVLSLVVFIFWISEPDLSLYERIRSAKALEKSGNYRAAAIKYEKSKNLTKAGECYLRAGLLESAAWCFERAGDYSKAAKIYENLAKKDSYYWKECYELYKKAGNIKDAAKCLEKYAEEEPWFWEDVAKMYEECKEHEKAKKAWIRALEYYTMEAKEEGVFWEDVAKIYERLNEKEKAKECWIKFLEYCIKEAEKDPAWWKHVAETYERIGEKEKAEEIKKKYRI